MTRNLTMRSATDINEGIALLQEACARNTPVELHHYSTTDELIVLRSRVLGMDAEHLYLDRAQRIGGTLTLRAGKTVTAYLLLHGKRYSFGTKVVHADCPVALNAQTQVRGMAVRKPRRVEEGQRREDFRISLACIDPIEAALHEVTSEDMNSCSLDAGRFVGRLVDISRGGCSVRVEAEERRSFMPGERFFIMFEASTHGGLVLPVEMCHAREILEGEANRIGLKVLAWNRVITKPHIQRLARFCADVERRARSRTK